VLHEAPLTAAAEPAGEPTDIGSVLTYAHIHAHYRDAALSLARTNLTLPADLLEEVDAIAGPRGRSRYVAEAVAQRVRRDRLGRAIHETQGLFAGTDAAMNRRQVSQWIDRLRSEDG
jgi:hypothetical protein